MVLSSNIIHHFVETMDNIGLKFSPSLSIACLSPCQI